jgi:kynureninase
MYAAESGYRIVDEVGVAAIREKSLRQTTMLIELAEEAGFAIRTCRKPAERGGVVVIDVPDGYQVTKELARREILVDYRPQAGIRVAPHFYTTDDEIRQTVSEIRSIVSAGVIA